MSWTEEDIKLLCQYGSLVTVEMRKADMLARSQVGYLWGSRGDSERALVHSLHPGLRQGVWDDERRTPARSHESSRFS